jgi:hypothetical protein
MISPRNRTRLQQPIGRSGVERRALRHIGGGERRGAAEDGLALLQPARVRGGRGRGYKYQPAPPRTYTAGADFSPARRRKKPGHRRRNKTRRRHRDRSRKVRRPFARSLPCARGGSSIDDFFSFPDKFFFFFPTGTKAAAFESYWDSTPSSI